MEKNNITDNKNNLPTISLVLSITLTIFGIIGNSVVFYIFSRYEFRKESFYRYILISNIFDTVNGLLIWPIIYQDYLLKKIPISCVLFYYIGYVTLTFSAWANVIASVDTYALIKFRKRFEFRQKLNFQLMIMLITFAISCLINLPHYFQVVCRVSCSNSESYFHVAYLTIIEIILPFTLMVIFTSLIFHELIASRKKVANQGNLKKRVRIFKIMFGINLLFLICHLPQSIVTIIYISKCTPYLEKIYFYFTYLRFFYFYLDIFIYFIANKRFRKYFLTHRAD